MDCFDYYVAYGSRGSVSSIINSLLAPVFFNMSSRILSKLLSKNFSRFILLYVIFIIYVLFGIFEAVNRIVPGCVVWLFDMSSIDTFVSPVAVFNFIDIAFASGLIEGLVKLNITLSPSPKGAFIYPPCPRLYDDPSTSALVIVVLFDIWYA